MYNNNIIYYISIERRIVLKETIYTIPVTDAFNMPCECPICILEKKLEDNTIESTLGASMMEPNARMESNKKGYCKKHFEIHYFLFE